MNTEGKTGTVGDDKRNVAMPRNTPVEPSRTLHEQLDPGPTVAVPRSASNTIAHVELFITGEIVDAHDALIPPIGPLCMPFFSIAQNSVADTAEDRRCTV